MKRVLFIACLLFAVVAFAETDQEMLSRAKLLRQKGVVLESVELYKTYLQRLPNDVEARIQLVEILMEIKQNERAADHIRILGDLAPKDPRVVQLMGILEKMQVKKKTSLLQDYETKLAQPNCPAATVLDFARYLSGIGNHARSIELYHRYLKMKSGDDQARLELAKVYGWGKQFKLSQEQLDLIFSHAAGNQEARLFCGDILYWQGEEDSALVQYRRVARDNPKNATASKKISEIVDSDAYKERMLLTALKTNRIGPELVGLASIYLKADREYEADSLIGVRLEAVPSDSVANAIRIDIANRRQEEKAKQVEKWQERLKQVPTDTSAMLQLARVYSQAGDWKEALNLYDSYLKRYPTDYRMRLERARILNWSGRTEDALSEFQLVVTALPDNRDAKLGLAQTLLYTDQNLPQVESIFRSDLTVYPNELSSLSGLAESLRRQGKYSEAKEVYYKIMGIDSTNVDAKQGMVLLEQDFGPMIRKLEENLKANPTDLGLRRRLAGLYLDSKRFYEAQEQIKYLLTDNPDDVRLQAMSVEVARQKEIYEIEALRLAKLHVLERPDSLEYRITYARLLAESGQSQEAIAQFQLIRERRSTDPATQMMLAELYSTNKQLKEAGSIYRELAEANPIQFEYRFRYAQTLSWDGDNERAIAEYERALRLNPQSVECQLGIANAYRWKGDMYAAYESFNRVLALNPRNEEAKKAITDLDGPFLRGIQVSTKSASDNADFLTRESKAMLYANFSLRWSVRAGFGTMEFSQDDFRERGWFVNGEAEYQFDKLTTGMVSVRSYQYSERATQSVYIEARHDFKDVPELVGLNGAAYYSNQDAIQDVGATKEILSWQDKLTTEKIGMSATYAIAPQWNLQLDAASVSISDKNTRTEVYADVEYVLKKFISVGARYEGVNASKEATDYWAPKNYSTLGGWLELKNTLPRFSYDVRAGFGRVQETNDAVRNGSASLDYRISNKLTAGVSYFFLRTIRTDGEYDYRALNGALFFNF